MGYIGQAPANKAVKTADIEDSAITAAKIADGTVVAGELASDSVTTAKILNANVTTAKLAADAVDGTKLADDAVNSEHYTDGSIDTAHIADDQITLAKMASGTDGNIISYDASGNPVAIATGTAGHFLKSQGAGSQPVFAAAGGGKINQVVTASKIDTSTFSSSSTNTYVDLAGLSVDITPSASSSKILVLMNIHVTYSTGMCHVRLLRDSTEIGSATKLSSQIGNIMGFRINDSDPYGLSLWNVSNHFVDSPSTTSATTYKLQGTIGSSYSGTFYINRSPNDTDANYGWRAPSNITVMEILA